jgi:hypothetical protein
MSTAIFMKEVGYHHLFLQMVPPWCLRYIWKYYPTHNSNIRRKHWRYQIGNQKRTSKDRQYNGQTKENKKTKQWSKKLHKKLEIERHETHEKQGLNSDGPERYAVLTGTRRVTLVANPPNSHERRKNRIVVYDKRDILLVIYDTDVP